MSTCWRWSCSAATSSAATVSSPARTSVRGSPLTIVFESARSFWLNVSRAASTTARKRVEAGLGRLDVERDPGRRRRRGRPAASPTSAPSANRRTVAGWATVERISATTSIASPRRAVDGVVSRSTRTSSTSPEADPPRLDLDAARRRERRLGLAVAGRVVAVGQEHDPLLGVVGEQRRGEPQRGADVGRGRDRRRGDPVDLGELGRQPLDERALAERDDPRHVAVGHLLERLAQEGEGVLAARRCRPSRTGRRRRPSPAGRPAGRAGTRPGRRRAPPAGASGRRARPGAGPSPSAAARRGAARPSAAAPGSAGAARAARRTRCPSGAPVRGVPPEPRAERRAAAGSARRGGRRPTRRTARRGRAGRSGPTARRGRSAGPSAGEPRPLPVPGRRPDAPATDAEGLDGGGRARARSSTRRRRTGRPRSGPGRSGRPAARTAPPSRRRAGPAGAAPVAASVARRRRPDAPDGAGRRARAEVRRDDVDARLVGAGERDRRPRARCPGTSSTTDPSGRVTARPVAPAGIVRLDRRARAGPPRSAPRSRRAARRSGSRAGSGTRPGAAGRSAAARRRGRRSAGRPAMPA